MMRNLILKSIILISIFCFSSITEAQVRDLDPQILHFDKMANYLCFGSGKWTGENKRYNPSNPKSPKAFGLWFKRPMKNLLTLKVVSYLKDTTMISSQGVFSYHPGKKQFIHVTADRGNGFSEGFSEFPNDSTFISIMKVYRPNGKIFDHKDENFVVNENVHRNTSFKKNENGEWIENGNWVWTRDPKK